MSFYVENTSDTNSDKIKEPSVANLISALSNVTADKIKHVETSAVKNDDNRKKRCTDRYDSSESSDSGVAVLSICGSSSSDITEPGSPYSPASCTSNGSSSEGAPGEGARPPWPWVPTTTSSPALTATRAKRPRADKCTNLESLITKKLHKNAAMPAHPEPAANYNNNLLVRTEEHKSNTQTSQHCCLPGAEQPPAGMPATKVLCQPPVQSGDTMSQIASIPKHIIHKPVPQPPIGRLLDRSNESKLKEDKVNQIKIQQGKITEYYKSQMKPSNGLKRDYAALISKVSELKGKGLVNGVHKSLNESNENLGNYLSYLSQTLDAKVTTTNKLPQKSQDTPSKPIATLSNSQMLETEKKPLPALNPILNSKVITPSINKKTEENHGTLGSDVNKSSKETKGRPGGARPNGKRSRTTEGKRSLVAKKTKGSQISPPPDSSDNQDNNASAMMGKLETTIVEKTAKTVADSNMTRQMKLSEIHDYMRQVLLQSQNADLKKRTNKSVKCQPFVNNISNSDRVPSVVNKNYCNSKISVVSNSASTQSTSSNLTMTTTQNTPSLQVGSDLSVHVSSQATNVQVCERNKQIPSAVSSSANILPNITMTPATANSVPNVTIPPVTVTSLPNVTMPSATVTSFPNVTMPSATVNTISNVTMPPATVNSIPNVTMPPATVMLTTIRIPQANMQQTSMINSDTSRTTPSHIAISPTKINGQFVLPMVQNINGTLVQIPNLVAKVGQNTMLPLNSPGIIQRAENIVNHQQTTQMFINGTLLKLNNAMHPNLSGLIAKQMTATSTTNVSYTVTQKNLTNAVSTVMGSKPNFTINPAMFASSPGFIINPMAGVVTAQAGTTNTLPPQQQFGGNVVLTTPLHPGMHINHTINNNMTSIPIPPGSIPISPIKLGDINRVFLAPSRPIIPNMKLSNDQQQQSMCAPLNPPTPLLPSNVQQSVDVNMNTSSEQYPKMNVISNLEKPKTVDVPEPAQIVTEVLPPTPSENVSFASEENVNNSLCSEDSRSLSPVVPKCMDNSVDSISIESASCSKINNSSILSEDTKTSIDSVSEDFNSSTNAIKSSDTSKEEESVAKDKPPNDDSCFKNPLLSTPKTIRFPAKASHSKMNARADVEENKQCRWHGCIQNFDNCINLLGHLQECHVNSQVGNETYKCLWQGCKVYNHPSCSSHWLERHVLSHGGTNKLFGCIVDGCTQRFNTQLAVERHVNSHFTNQGSNSSTVKKQVDTNNPGPKLIRRNGKKLRYRRQPWSGKNARTFDFFDAGIMEGLQYRIKRTAAWRTAGCKASFYSNERKASTVTVTATVLAKRFNHTQKHTEFLVTWSPADVIQDEWLPEKEFVPVKDVAMKSLGASAKDALYTGFCSSYRKPLPDIKMLNGCLSSTPVFNNAKTDSIITLTANETPLHVNNNIVKEASLGGDTGTKDNTKLTGAARRKQWKR